MCKLSHCLHEVCAAIAGGGLQLWENTAWTRMEKALLVVSSGFL